MTAPFGKTRSDPAKVLNALAQPLITVDGQGMVIEANIAAETFFDMGRAALLRCPRPGGSERLPGHAQRFLPAPRDCGPVHVRVERGRRGPRRDGLGRPPGRGA